jgi:hypothetical protein
MDFISLGRLSCSMMDFISLDGWGARWLAGWGACWGAGWLACLLDLTEAGRYNLRLVEHSCLPVD